MTSPTFGCRKDSGDVGLAGSCGRGGRKALFQAAHALAQRPDFRRQLLHRGAARRLAYRLERGFIAVLGPLVVSLGLVFLARDQLANRTLAETRHQLLSAFLDELPKRPHRGQRPIRVRPLFLFIDDLGQGDVRQVLLRGVVDDRHVFACAHVLGDLLERHVTAIAGIIEFAIRVSLDDPLRPVTLWLAACAHDLQYTSRAQKGFVVKEQVTEEPVALATALMRRVTSLADAHVRIAYLRTTLASLSARSIVELTTISMQRTEARDPGFGVLLLGICLALADEAMAHTRSEVAREALVLGVFETATLFAPTAPVRQFEEAHEVPDFGFGRPLSLGERKALARRRDRDLLARVLRDPAADVIRILLTNPALIEDDVVRLCSRRPLPPRVFREVFRSPRWVVRYRVQRAIVLNPFAPVDLGLQLAVHLTAPDARKAATQPELADELRAACRRVGRVQTYH